MTDTDHYPRCRLYMLSRATCPVCKEIDDARNKSQATYDTMTEETKRIIRERFERAQKPLLERIVGPDRVRFSKWCLYGCVIVYVVSILMLLSG